MKKNQLPFFVGVLLLFSSCKTLQNKSSIKDDGKLEVVFVQVNDVYEIAPLAGGKEGGMARVASLKKQYLQKNKNTLLVMAGDFLSPSVYNSLQHEGKAIRGKQMVDAMNAAAMDLVVFGNHEFDIKESELQERINESTFTWIATNAFHKKGDSAAPFAKNNTVLFPETHIVTFRDEDGTIAKIGFIGITLPFNKAEYVQYTDPVQSAKEAYEALKDSVDAVVAITHQAVADDVQMAKELPGLALVLGGHEHDNQFRKIGDVYVTKAHANAKSAYVVTLQINQKKGRSKAKPQLVYLNEQIPLDSVTNKVVQNWQDIASKSYSKSGFDAGKIVMNEGAPLDGREIAIRTGQTNLSRLIVAAMKNAAPQADVAVFNAGSIRVDDLLPMPLTQYDIIRTLPFGGGIREADMKGSLLIRTLNAGKANRGIGGFLHYNENLAFDEGSKQWKLNGSAIEAEKSYRVAVTDFLFTGKEANLDFLNPSNPDVIKVFEPQTDVSNPLSDIRLAIVRYLEKKK